MAAMTIQLFWRRHTSEQLVTQRRERDRELYTEYIASLASTKMLAQAGGLRGVCGIGIE